MLRETSLTKNPCHSVSFTSHEQQICFTSQDQRHFRVNTSGLKHNRHKYFIVYTGYNIPTHLRGQGFLSYYISVLAHEITRRTLARGRYTLVGPLGTNFISGPDLLDTKHPAIVSTATSNREHTKCHITAEGKNHLESTLRCSAFIPVTSTVYWCSGRDFHSDSGQPCSLRCPGVSKHQSIFSCMADLYFQHHGVATNR